MKRNINLNNHLASEFHHFWHLQISSHTLLRRILHQTILLGVLRNLKLFLNYTLKKKSEISPIVLKEDFRKLQTRYQDYKKGILIGQKTTQK